MARSPGSGVCRGSACGRKGLGHALNAATDMNAGVGDELFRWLEPDRLTAIVDVGANPIDGAPPYQPMLDRQLCTVVGFDPQAAAFELLQDRGPLETYLPYAVGDGT